MATSIQYVRINNVLFLGTVFKASKGKNACYRKILSWLAGEFGDILLDEIVDVTKDLLKMEQNCFLRGSSI